MSAEFPVGRLAAWPCGGGGVRASTHRWPPRQDFCCGRLPLVVMGRVVVIVEALPEREYLRCIADVVAARLARLQGEHGLTAGFAAGWLVGTGRWP
jgi:hypothetical protein